MKLSNLISKLAIFTILANMADGAVLRYRASGDWTKISEAAPGDVTGWGDNPNNAGVAGIALPGASDDARINWGGNTVTVSTSVPDVDRLQIGVDENGNLDILNGGSLSSVRDVLVGNNNSNVTDANLNIRGGGELSVGGILWSSNSSATGHITVDSGGLLNVGNHLWLGVTQTSTISIAGTLTQTGGILGLGTNNASTPSGGSASVTIESGGLLALNNISANGTNSIQSGSSIDIVGTGRLTLPGNHESVLGNYVAANLITGNGNNGAVTVFFDGSETVVTAIPEPSSALLLGLAGAFGFCRRKR